MKYILKQKSKTNLDLNDLKDLKELLHLHEIVIIDAEEFPEKIIVEAEENIKKINFEDWHVQYENIPHYR